ncbi:MAG: hypothetical protein ABID79_04885 [Elusimicrobiota bacterium]
MKLHSYFIVMFLLSLPARLLSAAPDMPSNLAQLNDSGNILVSMEWSTSSVIVSSFTLSDQENNQVKFHIQVTSQTSGDIADWSLLVFSYTSSLISTGTTNYMWPALADKATYWWRVWCEDEGGLTSSTSTVLGVDGAAKLGFEPVLSVNIILETPYDFAEVALGASTQTISVISVQNDGNTPETFAIKCETNTVGSPWYPGPTQGADRFVLKALFNSNQPAISSFAGDDVVSSGTYTTSSASVFSIDGSYAGSSISANVIKNLWLRLDMPTTSQTAEEQGMILYIRAESP